MSLSYLHGEGYIIPIFIFLAAIFIGIPALIGVFYYWRRKQRQAEKQRGIKLRD